MSYKLDDIYFGEYIFRGKQMTWEVRLTEEFESWFLGLSDAEQVDVLAMLDVLEIKGPALGRPQADTLKGTTKLKNLKELRIQHAGKPYRVFYAFDPVPAEFQRYLISEGLD